jgi:hypothetical protein
MVFGNVVVGGHTDMHTGEVNARTFIGDGTEYKSGTLLSDTQQYAYSLVGEDIGKAIGVGREWARALWDRAGIGNEKYKAANQIALTQVSDFISSFTTPFFIGQANYQYNPFNVFNETDDGNNVITGTNLNHYNKVQQGYKASGNNF